MGSAGSAISRQVALLGAAATSTGSLSIRSGRAWRIPASRRAANRRAVRGSPPLLPPVLGCDAPSMPPDVAHLDRLYRTARAFTGSAREADGLVEDTYARLLSAPPRPENDLAHLVAALRRTFMSTRRGPEQPVAVNDVFAAIAALPSHQREVVAAVDVAGISHRETADVLGVPIGTVMSRLYHARGRLAAQFAGAAA